MSSQTDQICRDALAKCLALAPDIHLARTGQALAERPALASLAGVSRRAVYKWKRIPSEHCLRLEQAFDGAVNRYEMRPDVFGQEASAA